jgi:hypothetical protein
MWHDVQTSHELPTAACDRRHYELYDFAMSVLVALMIGCSRAAAPVQPRTSD